ncbi:hypothetical protein LF934_15950 [Dickeya dadantii]|uniref:hypothetical protein n=1 Tax=Dickeya dadantii TaxID=204038 RepID=UPI001CF40B08|nr:hypothetical protein [Dickeya dadantii]MCA7014128.1 hypothetical protein [Dickeya dadantii]
MREFELPVLEYFSLERAARFIGAGCEVDDLLHWAEIGAIRLSHKFKGNEEYSAFIHFHGNPVDVATKIFNANQLDDYHINISQFSIIATSEFDDCHSVDDVLAVLTRYSDKAKVKGYLRGVWELNRYFVDHNMTKSYTRVVLKPFGDALVDSLATIPDEVGFSEKELLISKYAVNKIIGEDAREIHADSINNNDVVIEAEEESKTIANNRASLIKSLLAIHYGEDVANNPRKFIENKDSDICKDFDLKGISLPSGKTVATWLQDADIDFL